MFTFSISAQKMKNYQVKTKSLNSEREAVTNWPFVQCQFANANRMAKTMDLN